jgi:hypothetical protein
MKSLWTNKKHGKTLFVSYYEKDKKSERTFILIATKAPFRRITFESYQAAKSLGWMRVK